MSEFKKVLAPDELIIKFEKKKNDEALSEIFNQIVGRGYDDLVRFFLNTVDIKRFGEERLITAAKIAIDKKLHSTLSLLMRVIKSSSWIDDEFDRMIELNEHVKDDVSYNMVNSVLARKLKEDTYRRIFDAAIRRNRIDIIRSLLKYGVSYDEEDIQLAEDHGFEEIADILRRELRR